MDTFSDKSSNSSYKRTRHRSPRGHHNVRDKSSGGEGDRRIKNEYLVDLMQNVAKKKHPQGKVRQTTNLSQNGCHKRLENCPVLREYGIKIKKSVEKYMTKRSSESCLQNDKNCCESSEAEGIRDVSDAETIILGGKNDFKSKSTNTLFELPVKPTRSYQLRMERNLSLLQTKPSPPTSFISPYGNKTNKKIGHKRCCQQNGLNLPHIRECNGRISHFSDESSTNLARKSTNPNANRKSETKYFPMSVVKQNKTGSEKDEKRLIKTKTFFLNDGLKFESADGQKYISKFEESTTESEEENCANFTPIRHTDSLSLIAKTSRQWTTHRTADKGILKRKTRKDRRNVDSNESDEEKTVKFLDEQEKILKKNLRRKNLKESQSGIFLQSNFKNVCDWWDRTNGHVTVRKQYNSNDRTRWAY